MSEQRPSRDELFMRTAHLFAERATCPRGHVGAVLVRDDRIIATGYNGAPPGLPHCDEVGCDELVVYLDRGSAGGDKEVNLGCQRTVHAEANTIAFAAQYGMDTAGAVMYCTHSPCRKCLEIAACAGVMRIVFDKPYRATPWQLARDLKIPLVERHYDQSR